MAIPCETIITLRRRYVQLIGEVAKEKYAAISNREHELLAIQYLCCMEDVQNIAESIKNRLCQSRTDDLRRGVTGFGVHREDVLLTLSGREMKVFASQGQIRTAALSMKLAQLEIFRQEAGEAPILLLDDVMSELDMSRRKRLLQEMDGIQTFITCTDESDLEGCTEKRSYQVSAGEDGIAQIRENSEGEMIDQEQAMTDLDF